MRAWRRNLMGGRQGVAHFPGYQILSKKKLDNRHKDGTNSYLTFLSYSPYNGTQVTSECHIQ